MVLDPNRADTNANTNAITKKKFDEDLALKQQLELYVERMSRTSFPCNGRDHLVNNGYLALELLLGTKQYSTTIDMWSLGCIMVELLSKEPLLNGKTEFEQLDKIFRILGTPNETIWPGFSKLPRVKVNFVKNKYNLLHKKFPVTSFTGSPILFYSGFDLLNKLLTYDPEKANEENIKESRSISRATLEGDVAGHFLLVYVEKCVLYFLGTISISGNAFLGFGTIIFEALFNDKLVVIFTPAYLNWLSRIWLKSHSRRQRWVDKSYKKSHLGIEWKKPFAGSSYAKGIGLEKIGIEAKQPNSAIPNCVRVQLIKNWKKIAAFVPNDGCLNYIEEHASACPCLLWILFGNFRQYELWERYAELYPDKDLIYTTGVSDYTKDWFFAQKDDNTYQGSTWQIKFKLDSVNKSSTYKLRVALASAILSTLQDSIVGISNHLSSFSIPLSLIFKKQRTPLMKKIQGLQAPYGATSCGIKSNFLYLFIINMFFNVKNMIFSLSSSPNAHPNPDTFSTTHDHGGHHEPSLLAAEPSHQEEYFNQSGILIIYLKDSVEKNPSILYFIAFLRIANVSLPINTTSRIEGL
ncbi:Cyclin-dependent kinase G-2 [Glycine soja]